MSAQSFDPFDPRHPDGPPVTGYRDPGAGPYGSDRVLVDDTGDERVVDDLSTILGDPTEFTLVSGLRVRLRPLKTRELFALTRIIMAGLGPQIGAMQNLDPDEPTKVFIARFAGMLLTSLPQAEDETIAFLRMVIDPADLVVEGRIDKAVETRNNALRRRLDAEMANPEPDDTVTICEAVARQEAGDLQALGKRLAGIVTAFRRTGQIPASPTSQG